MRLPITGTLSATSNNTDRIKYLLYTTNLHGDGQKTTCKVNKNVHTNCGHCPHSLQDHDQHEWNTLFYVDYKHRIKLTKFQAIHRSWRYECDQKVVKSGRAIALRISMQGTSNLGSKTKALNKSVEYSTCLL